MAGAVGLDQVKQVHSRRFLGAAGKIKAAMNKPTAAFKTIKKIISIAFTNSKQVLKTWGRKPGIFIFISMVKESPGKRDVHPE